MRTIRSMYYDNVDERLPKTQAATMAALGFRDALIQDNATGTGHGAWLDQISFIPGVPPTITGHPVSQSVSAGANVTFSVTATGAAPLSYQWQFNGVNRTGATDSTLVLPGVTTNQSGPYQVIVTNVAGAITSTVAALSAGSSSRSESATGTIAVRSTKQEHRSSPLTPMSRSPR